MTKILCLLKKDFLELEDKSVDNILNLLDKSYYWVEREHAETDESYLQIIPYLIIEKQNNFGEEDSEFFMYQRLKKGKEARLHDNYSLGVGGHIDWDKDGVTLYNLVPSRDVVFMSAKDELNEEVNLLGTAQNFSALQPDDVLWLDHIYDDSNAVGRVHLGLVGIVTIYGNDKTRIEVKEKEKLSGGLVAPKEIEQKKDKLENWSKIAWGMFQELEGNQADMLEEDEEDTDVE